MLRLIFWVAVILGLRLAFGRESKDTLIVKAAAEGNIDDLENLASSYWKLYEETHRRKSEWVMLNRVEKSAVYKSREQLRDLFEQFPKEAQTFVIKRKPDQKF